MQAIPPNLAPQEVLDRYLTEQTTSQIAASYGVARKSMVAWLRETCPEEWKNVQVIRALLKKEDADEALEAAADALSLARARELLRSGQWDLERLDSRNYGQKQEVTMTVQTDFGERLRRARERVIEGEKVPLAPDVAQITHDAQQHDSIIDVASEQQIIEK